MSSCLYVANRRFFLKIVGSTVELPLQVSLGQCALGAMEVVRSTRIGRRGFTEFA